MTVDQNDHRRFDEKISFGKLSRFEDPTHNLMRSCLNQTKLEYIMLNDMCGGERGDFFCKQTTRHLRSRFAAPRLLVTQRVQLFKQIAQKRKRHTVLQVFIHRLERFQDQHNSRVARFADGLLLVAENDDDGVEDDIRIDHLHCEDPTASRHRFRLRKDTYRGNNRDEHLAEFRQTLWPQFQKMPTFLPLCWQIAIREKCRTNLANSGIATFWKSFVAAATIKPYECGQEQNLKNVNSQTKIHLRLNHLRNNRERINISTLFKKQTKIKHRRFILW